MDQTNLLKNWIEFGERYRPRTKKDTNKKRNTCESVNAL